MKMPPDDSLAFRKALEPLTLSAVEADGSELALASIAISIKRIADALVMSDAEAAKERAEERVVSCDAQTGDIVVQDPGEQTMTTICAGVVWVEESMAPTIEKWGWRVVPGLDGKPVNGLVRVSRR